MWLRLSALLMLAYPLMAPFFLWFGEPMFLVVILAAILLFVTLDRVQKKDIKGGVLSLLGLGGIVSLFLFNFSPLLVYVPPVLIPLGLFIIFHQSLAEESKPIITLYAESIDGPISKEVNSYTRSLTKVWRAVFLCLAIESLVLAVFAAEDVWIWFTHIINYLIIFFVFAGEFIYRRHRFGNTSSSFLTFLRKISVLRPKDLVQRK